LSKLPPTCISAYVGALGSGRFCEQGDGSGCKGTWGVST